MFRSGVTLVLILPLLFPATAPRAEETITWIRAEFPPLHILSGPRAGQGIEDKSQDYFTAHLPLYRHVTIEANFSRIFKQMEQGDGVCATGMLKTPEREKEALFSDHYAISWSQQLITTESRRSRFDAYLDADGRVDLSMLAHDHTLMTARPSGRAYLPRIEQLLNEPGMLGRVMEVPQTPSLFKMLESDRVDYIFAYPLEIKYYAALMNLKGSFVSLPIAQVPLTIDAFVACSDKPVGRKVISSINEMIRHFGRPNPIIRSQWEWLGPDSGQALENFWEGLQ